MVATVLGNMFVNARPMPIQVFLNVFGNVLQLVLFEHYRYSTYFSSGWQHDVVLACEGYESCDPCQITHKDTHCTTSRACFGFFGACILVMAFQHPTHTLF